jgi:hypothetical protein
MQNISELPPHVQQQSIYNSKYFAPDLARCPEGGGLVREQGGASPISCPHRIVNFGLDTIYINLWIEWRPSRKSELFQVLADKKACLQSGMEDEMPFQFGRSEIFAFNLQRNGSRFQKYCMTTGDIRMYLDPRESQSSNPNMVLQIGSLSSNQNPAQLLSQLRNFINYHGGVIIKEDVTRVDLCADYKGDIQETGIFSMDRWITRATKHSFHGTNRINSGVTIGKGDLLCRVYSKQQEMIEKKAWEKLIFFNGKWGLEPHEKVTRVEFQLRGKALKEMFFNDKPLMIIELNYAFIWAYLTEKWFRLAATSVDRHNNNQAHTKTSEFWKIIQQASSFEAPPIQRNRKQKHINIPDLKKQVAGCLITICAGLGHVVEDLYGMVSTGQDIVKQTVMELFDEPDFKQRYLSKQISAYVSF